MNDSVHKLSLTVFMLIGTCLSTPALSDALCVEDNTTKCTNLGYTASSCKYGGIACPYDTSLWYCAKYTCDDARLADSCDTSYWTTCTSREFKDKTCYERSCEETTKSCQIGNVYYSDGTCSKNYAECIGKTPIGVVFMLTDLDGNVITDPKHPKDATSLYGKIVALDDLTLNSSYLFSLTGSNTSIPWGASGFSIDGLTSYGWNSVYPVIQKYIGHEGTSDVYAGQANTLKIVNSYSHDNCSSISENTEEWATSCYPTAAEAAYAYYPNTSLKKDAAFGQSNWYLPSIGELMELNGLDPYSMTEDGGNSGATGSVYGAVNERLYQLRERGVSASWLKGSGSYYLSSTNMNASHAWVLKIANGERSHGLKTNQYLARAIASFNNTGFTPIRCALGDIYYADGSCSDTAHYDSSKVPAGVVYMLTNASGDILDSATASSPYGKILSLNNLTLSQDSSGAYSFDPENPHTSSTPKMYFGAYGTNVADIKNYATGDISGLLTDALGQEGSSDLYNGQLNTILLSEVTGTAKNCSYDKKSIEYWQSCAPTAALATLAFHPIGTGVADPIVGAGRWYLPAVGEVAYMYQAPNQSNGAIKNTINTTLVFLANKLGDTSVRSLNNQVTKTSTESIKNSADSAVEHLGVNLSGGTFSSADRSASHPTRAVLEFRSSYCAKGYYLNECPSGATCDSCTDGKTLYKIVACEGAYSIDTNGVSCVRNGLCEIGDVLYSDGQCDTANTYDGTRTPVGIVYLTTDANGRITNSASAHGRVVSLHKLYTDSTYNYTPTGSTSTFIWGLYGVKTGQTYYNLLSVNGSINAEQALLSAGNDSTAAIYDGESNTEILLVVDPTDTNCTNGTYKPGTDSYNLNCIASAAALTRQYYPDGLEDDPQFGAGNWYLMSYGELVRLGGMSIKSNAVSYEDTTLALVNEALATLKKKGLTTDDSLGKVLLLSSTERTATRILKYNPYTKLGSEADQNKNTASPIWPGLRF